MVHKTTMQLSAMRIHIHTHPCIYLLCLWLYTYLPAFACLRVCCKYLLMHALNVCPFAFVLHAMDGIRTIEALLSSILHLMTAWQRVIAQQINAASIMFQFAHVYVH